MHYYLFLHGLMSWTETKWPRTPHPQPTTQDACLGLNHITQRIITHLTPGFQPLQCLAQNLSPLETLPRAQEDACLGQSHTIERSILS